MDYNTERENNIIKNIAKEIVIEASRSGHEVTQELANYLVKLKLLNPKNGFTAAEVMPRSLTQQLVQSVIEDVKQDTPVMNCIRMQVIWNNVNLNLDDLKSEYVDSLGDKTESIVSEILSVEEEDGSKLLKLIGSFIVTYQNLGNASQAVQLKETVAALHSVFKNKDSVSFFESPEETKVDKIKKLASQVSGIRLYLKSIGKAGEGIPDVKDLTRMVESYQNKNTDYMLTVAARIEDIREVISNVVIMDYFSMEPASSAEVYLPPECDMNDLKTLKKILVIMIQHSVYLSDIESKLDEVDGNTNFRINQYEEALKKLQNTIRDRDAVPTSEVYDDFTKVGEYWRDIQSYIYCMDLIGTVIKKLENCNKMEYFIPTPIERAVNLPPRPLSEIRRKSAESKKSMISSNVLVLQGCEEYHLEFRGFCAWTLFFADGFLVPGNTSSGIFEHKNLFYTFANKAGYELWSKEPQYYLMETYEILRANPEMVDLLNVYDQLYSTKSFVLTKKVDRKMMSRAEETQTVVHPIEKHWDKEYTFSEWELKKRALLMSRIIKCVTKSSQTVNHSHFRSSIGVYAAPNKNKEVQTKRDNSCVHSTVANYLYGLRGHYENKFRVLTLTRPPEENCEREILRSDEDRCNRRLQPIPVLAYPSSSSSSGTPSNWTEEESEKSTLYASFKDECNEENF